MRKLGQQLTTHSLFSFAQSSADIIRDEELKPEIRMAVAHTFKATVSYWTEKTLKELMVRVGWQAMYSVNQISENYMNHIGSWVAEGEVMMLCIRERPLPFLLIPPSTSSPCTFPPPD